MANLHYVIILFSIFVMTKFIQCDQDGVRVIQQEPINIFLKDNDDLKVDLDISDDNYEILDKQYTKLRNKNEDKLFQEFNR